MNREPSGGVATRRTKIVATLGPATGTDERIAALVDAGVNVVRVNASHGTAEVRGQWIAAVRRIAEARGAPIAVLMDLQGPRIRVGALKAPQELVRGQEVVFAPEAVARKDELPTTYAELAQDARVGARILLNDGLLSVEVTRVEPRRVWARVVDGGTLTAHKGMNLPGLQVSAPALTDKDREDVADAVAHGVDYLALSFVRRAEDMVGLRALVPPAVKLVAKIEKATALDDLERILRTSDAVMVARGDLGVELPFEEVPLVQKRLIREANRHGKPVITATQMLESMIQNPRPTRAEASDVANAILDGTDAVMLSAETASGLYPREAVAMMARIVQEAESNMAEFTQPRRRAQRRLSIAETICESIAHAAEDLHMAAIAVFTESGNTARLISKYRPPTEIYAFSHTPAVCNRMNLLWGVQPVRRGYSLTAEQMLSAAEQELLRRGSVKSGNVLGVVAGTQMASGSTNFMRLHVVTAEEERKAARRKRRGGKQKD